MNRQALVVGINRYPFLNNLDKPASDAEAIADLLKNYGHFSVVHQIPTIPDGTFKIDPKGNVTAPELKEAIIKLFAIGEKNCPDTALLFFAGHGLREPRGLKEGFLATSEACPRKEVYGVSLSWLQDILLESEVKQQVIWLDCGY